MTNDDDARVVVEQQLETLIGKITPIIAELDSRLRQLSVPDSASEKTRLILQCLPAWIERPRQQLQQISDARPITPATDIVVIVGALWNFMILTERALKEARAIGDKRAQRRQLVSLEEVCGEMFTMMNTIAECARPAGDSEQACHCGNEIQIN